MSLRLHIETLLPLVPMYFLAAIALHAALCRLVRRGGAFAKFLLAGSAGGLALSFHAFSRRQVDVETAAGILVYALACEFYIFLFSMVSSSISVSLLLILGAHRPVLADVETLYSSHGMVTRRLEKLVASGLLSQGDAGYRVTEKGWRLIRILGRLRIFFGHAGAGPAASPRVTAS
jgi:hypothetical protein